MSKVSVRIEPNIEYDIQHIDLDDMDISLEEWGQLSEDEQRDLAYECIADNLYGVIVSTEIVE